MKRLLLAILLVVLFPWSAFAVDDIMTVDEETMVLRLDGRDRNVTKLTFTIVSNTDGTLVDPVLTVGKGRFAVTKKYSGTIIWATITPDSGGTAPDANYDIALVDNSDVTIDYLGGLGDNCSQTVTKAGVPVDEVNGGPVHLLNSTLDIYGGGAAGASGMNAVNGCILRVWIAQ